MGQIQTITCMDIVTAIAAALTAGVLIFAAIYARRQLHSMERAREAQLLVDLSRRWDEEPLVQSRRAVETYKDTSELWQALKNLKKKNHEQYYVLLKVANFYEDLALLINEKCLTAELVKNMLGDAIKHYYELYEVTIKEMREKYKSSRIYENFEDLAKKVND